MRHLTLLLGAAASILSITAAQADIGDQIFKLLPDDGEPQERFGISVDLSGTTAVVGAYLDDDNGGDSGSAYLFDTTTGKQLFKLLADDGSAGDWFGHSAGISGATAIVGARYSSAYLFDTTTGIQIAQLRPEDGAGGGFGYSVAISGNTAIVGAYWDNTNGKNSGSAYLFDSTTGQQLFKLLPDDGAPGVQFGFSVGISGTIAIVGTQTDLDDIPGPSHAYLFDTTTGEQLLELLPEDGTAQGFGVSVAISGTTAIVGAWADGDGNGNDLYFGSAYLFDSTTGQQLFKLRADDAGTGGRFGWSVAINDTTATIGSLLSSAYLFDTETGQQITKLLPNNGEEALCCFGYAVGINDDHEEKTAIVGNFWADNNGKDSGAAFLFDAAFDATLFFEPDQPYLSEADSPLDKNSAGFILENFEDGLFNIPGVSVSGGEVRFPGPFTDSVDLDDGVLDGFGIDGHVFRPPDGQTSLTFTFDAKVLGQLPIQAGLVWTDGHPRAVVTIKAENAQGICVVESQVTLGDDVHNGETAEDRFLGVAFANGIGALSISTTFGGLEVDHVQFVVSCPWDLDDNDTVGASDLLSLLASWGPCKGCPADFDGNGNVGASDLLTLLANWGPCP